MNEQELRVWLDDNGVDSIRVESIALDGWLFGKYVSPNKLIGSLGPGLPTADIGLAYDLGGTPILGWWDDWRAELGDIFHVPDLATLTTTSTDGMASVMADLTLLSGEPVPIDARSILAGMVERLAGLGFQAKVAIELEAYVFADPIDEARQRQFSDLSPLGDPRPVGYGVGRSLPMVTYMNTVARRTRAIGIDWEAWSNEIGPGQIEFNIAPADPISTADSVMRVKTIMREVAEELGHSVTFLSKPIDSYPNGLHINHSLLRNGEPVFLTTEGERSGTMLNWLGGLMASMPASMSIFSPNPTSYRRLVDAEGPPTTVTWGENNKSTGIRSITRSPAATRFEHRVPASDANCYLAIAAVLAGGIRGLEDELAPPPAFTGLAWNVPESLGVDRLPNSITKAAAALEADNRLSDILGTDFVRHWVETRRWEWMMFHTTGGDPDAPTGVWELDRYFEWV